MKKIYSLIVLITIVLAAAAQTRQPGPWVSSIEPSSAPLQIQVQVNALRAAGDTLMYMPLEEIIVNPTDSAAFTLVTEDVDGLTPNNSGVPLDFGVFYSTNADTGATGLPSGDNFFHPWEDPLTDSTFFWYATSWFNPAGTANNWLMFGPITIPANGAVISWYERCNPAYRDGYKVSASITASSPITSSDFADPAFYTRTSVYPSPTYATDTTWVQKSVLVPATYNGMPTYFAFNHDAPDMDVLYLDEITITEGPVSVNETVKEVTVFQNQPNPVTNFTNVSYMLNKPAAVSMDVVDVTGRVVMSFNEGNQATGRHNIMVDVKSLNAGIYFYTLKANGAAISNRMVITK